MPNFDSWETELYHHGILGQKWGIRRFQNKDGSLTPAGIKRQARNEAKIERAKIKAERIKSKAESFRRVSELTDAELQKKINRLKLEKQYKELNPSSLEKGMRVASKVLNFVQERASAARQEKLQDREYAMKSRELGIQEQELKVRKKEQESLEVQARERTKQSRANALQSFGQAKQAKQNRKKAEQDARKEEAVTKGLRSYAGRKKAKAELRLARNQKKSINLVKNILNRRMNKSFMVPDDYNKHIEQLLANTKVGGSNNNQNNNQDNQKKKYTLKK